MKQTGGGPPIPEPQMLSGNDYPTDHPANPLFVFENNPAAKLWYVILLKTKFSYILVDVFLCPSVRDT